MGAVIGWAHFFAREETPETLGFLAGRGRKPSPQTAMYAGYADFALTEFGVSAIVPPEW